ncbi:MAG: DNA-protecting protein DprA [Clostridia bacterium]|nr:DNA-protecting protein DprA [Clostridia bacterium]
MLTLVTAFGSAQAAWRARPEALKGILNGHAFSMLLALRSQLCPSQEMDRLDQHGVRAITLYDHDYPEPLRQVYNPPAVLYVKGNLPPSGYLGIAIVGTRRATSYGKKATELITRELAKHDIWIISGLARGIDGQAHRTCVENQGHTIAVLGCGLDIVYPPEHARLAQEIIERGALVSEHPLGVAPEAKHFPARNRIISGLARGVLVAEAPKRSGALITAEFALEQGRDVFAVPGPITSITCEGNNNLLKEGAKAVTQAGDILEEYGLKVEAQIAIDDLLKAEPAYSGQLSARESEILSLISYDPVHIDEIVEQLRLPVAKIQATLTLLEMKGIIQQLPGKYFVRQ